MILLCLLQLLNTVFFMSPKDKLHRSPKHCCYQLHSLDFGCVPLTLFRSKNTNVYFPKITPTKIVMLSEYKEKFQHRFRSKCYRCVFLNLPPKKSLEVILFILIPELRQSNVPLSSVRALKFRWQWLVGDHFLS